MNSWKSTGAAEITVERKPDIHRGRARRRHRDRKNRVRAELSLVGRSIEIDHRPIDRDLIHRRHPVERGSDALLHALDRLLDSLAEIALRVAISQLQRLVLSGRCSARYRGAAECPALQQNVRLDGGVAATVQNLSCADRCYGRHVLGLVA